MCMIFHEKVLIKKYLIYTYVSLLQSKENYKISQVMFVSIYSFIRMQCCQQNSFRVIDTEIVVQ